MHRLWLCLVIHFSPTVMTALLMDSALFVHREVCLNIEVDSLNSVGILRDLNFESFFWAWEMILEKKKN